MADTGRGSLLLVIVVIVVRLERLQPQTLTGTSVRTLENKRIVAANPKRRVGKPQRGVGFVNCVIHDEDVALQYATQLPTNRTLYLKNSSTGTL